MNYLLRSRLGTLSTAGLWACALLMSMPGSGALPLLEQLPTIEGLRNRLELTPEQEKQLVPLLEKRKSELRQTKTLLEQASSDQQQRTVLRDAEQAGNAFSAQVEKLLTPSQQHEWRAFLSEQREKAKERIEETNESR